MVIIKIFLYWFLYLAYLNWLLRVPYENQFYGELLIIAALVLAGLYRLFKPYKKEGKILEKHLPAYSKISGLLIISAGLAFVFFVLRSRFGFFDHVINVFIPPIILMGTGIAIFAVYFVFSKKT